MSRKETFDEILARARRLNLDEARTLGVIDLPNCRGADGRPIVVLTPSVVDPKRLQDRDFVDRLKCFLLLSLDGVSQEEYNVILFATSMKWSLKLFRFLFSEVYAIMPRPVKKNIKALHIVHASDPAKFFLRMILFMVSRKFWRKVNYVNRVADLAVELQTDVSGFIPKFVLAHELRHAERLRNLRGNAGGGATKDPTALTPPTAGPQPGQEQPPGAIFGQPLNALPCNEHGIPDFLIKLESLLQVHALGQEGLFRIPPPQDDLTHARALLDSHKTPTFFAAAELQPEQVNIIGTLYKLFFRRLPVPLIPFAQYDSLIAAQQRDESAIIAALEQAVVDMPSEHRNTLLHLMQFLTLVAVQSQSNKMGMSNLALIFAPSILRSADLNPLLELSSIKARVEVVKILFDNLDRFEAMDVFDEVRRPTSAEAAPADSF